MVVRPIEVKTLLANGVTDNDEATLTTKLRIMTLKQLKALAKNLNIKLTGSSKKAEVIDRMLAMSRIGVIRGHRTSNGDNTSITYITEEVKSVLKALPPFLSVTEHWRMLDSTLKDFTFMDLLVYLVYSRDKIFDMHSLKAFKSLKAYKFFMMDL